MIVTGAELDVANSTFQIKRVLELELDRSPVYGYYRERSDADVLARIDWLILHGYLALEYDGRLPLLVYTAEGWEIEKETYAYELLDGLDERLHKGAPFEMDDLKDRNRALIFLLLEKIEATGDREYIPLLKAWAQQDYRKVRQWIQRVINGLQSPRSEA